MNEYIIYFINYTTKKIIASDINNLFSYLGEYDLKNIDHITELRVIPMREWVHKIL